MRLDKHRVGSVEVVALVAIGESGKIIGQGCKTGLVRGLVSTAAQLADLCTQWVEATIDSDTSTAAPVDLRPPKPAEKVLDRVHQRLTPFGLGRAEAVNRFVVVECATSDGRFWKAAHSLSSLD